MDKILTHPVDILKDLMEQVGEDMDDGYEKQLREICDKEVCDV